MKKWIGTFTAVLAAGIILIFVFSRWQTARDEDARALAKWNSASEKVITEIHKIIEQETGNQEYIGLELYSGDCVSLLENPPKGADTERLKSALDDARAERARWVKEQQHR